MILTCERSMLLILLDFCVFILFVFILFLVCNVTCVPLGCPPLCAPTVFSGLTALVFPYGLLWVVRPCVPLRFSLDCPSLCAPKVFSGFSALVCPYGFLWVVRPCVPLQFFSNVCLFQGLTIVLIRSVIANISE
jgi:hypothetical protein